MRIPPYVLAVLVALAVAVPAGAQTLPGDDNSIQYPDYGGYDCTIWPEYCGGGGSELHTCWNCARYGMAPIYYRVFCCRDTLCDQLKNQGYTIEYTNLSWCQVNPGQCACCYGASC